MNSLHLLNIYPETISDGFGMRYSIYLAGCAHYCEGCHNPSSWNPQSGYPITTEVLNQMIDEINKNTLLDGITISGGDPFYNPKALHNLLYNLKKATKQNIWCYTGYTLEEIQKTKELAACLSYIDVLVDGRYIEGLFDPTLSFIGSSNQRIIQLNKIK